MSQHRGGVELTGATRHLAALVPREQLALIHSHLVHQPHWEPQGKSQTRNYQEDLHEEPLGGQARCLGKAVLPHPGPREELRESM